MSDETRIIALIGDPVSHSLSPRMQNAAIGAAGIDATYIPLRTKQAAFAPLVAELLRNGGACNVTSPFKDDAFALPGGRHTEMAQRTRSVNCVWGSPEAPDLDNTDVAGIRTAARNLVDARTVRVVELHGAGATARSAAVAVAEEWPDAVVQVVARDAAKADAFVAWAESAGVRAALAPPTFTRRADLVINATPLTDALPSRSQDVPDPELTPPRPGAFLDLNYRPGGTPLVLFMTSLRVPAVDGREVLLAQGAAAFERFFGMSAPIDVMRSAVEYALRS